MRRIYLLLIGVLVAVIGFAAYTRLTGPLTPEKIASLPAERRPTIMALGDSITQGGTVMEAEAYPAVLERLLAERGYPHRVINKGIQGLSSKTVYNYLPGLLELKPDLVIVGIGFADKYWGEQNTKENLAGVIKQFQEAGVQVVLTGQENNPTIYQELAAQFNVPLIPDLRQGWKEIGGIAVDDVHCTTEGCQHTAEHNVLPVILPLLSKDLK